MVESIMYSHNCTDEINNINKECPIRYFSPMEERGVEKEDTSVYTSTCRQTSSTLP